MKAQEYRLPENILKSVESDHVSVTEKNKNG